MSAVKQAREDLPGASDWAQGLGISLRNPYLKVPLRADRLSERIALRADRLSERIDWPNDSHVGIGGPIR